MAEKGVCELCGFADDSFRIEENGAVMKVCKFCHDGYLERMGLTPEADKSSPEETLHIDIDALKSADIDTDGMTAEELLQLKMELEARSNTRVPTLDESQLDTLLATTEDDKKVLTGVRQKENRRRKRAAAIGLDDSGEDYKASEELLRSGEELQRVVEGLQKVAKGIDDAPPDAEEEPAPLIAKIVAPRVEGDDPVREEQAEKTGKTSENVTKSQPKGASRKENDMKTESKPQPKEEARAAKEAQAREKIHAAANQTIDDERISITSPEVELRRDRRPKTNLDVAISEYAGGVRFLDAFKYVLHRVSYAVFLGLIVLAVSTVLFIRDGWQHGLIVLGGGAGAVLLGFMLAWYLSHCYELDRRALLLRIRQQEILFDAMNSDCYRELRTKYTMIKALGWLLNKLSVLLPLVMLVGGNVAAVILAFLQKYWLFPVVSACATVAGVLMYYLIKFAADRVAYTLDRERNQQIQQQTLLDILQQLKK
ncbi:MAG: hypothetical protein K2L51_02410 [Clostridiales bacterium]|nr:hypothetical protein [Clostridiales bacterium]